MISKKLSAFAGILLLIGCLVAIGVVIYSSGLPKPGTLSTLENLSTSRNTKKPEEIVPEEMKKLGSALEKYFTQSHVAHKEPIVLLSPNGQQPESINHTRSTSSSAGSISSISSSSSLPKSANKVRQRTTSTSASSPGYTGGSSNQASGTKKVEKIQEDVHSGEIVGMRSADNEFGRLLWTHAIIPSTSPFQLSSSPTFQPININGNINPGSSGNLGLSRAGLFQINPAMVSVSVPMPIMTQTTPTSSHNTRGQIQNSKNFANFHGILHQNIQRHSQNQEHGQIADMGNFEEGHELHENDENDYEEEEEIGEDVAEESGESGVDQEGEGGGGQFQISDLFDIAMNLYGASTDNSNSSSGVGTDFQGVIRMINETVNKGNQSSLLTKLNELYTRPDLSQTLLKKKPSTSIFSGHYENSLTTFAFMSFGVFLLNQIHSLISKSGSSEDHQKSRDFGSQFLLSSDSTNEVESKLDMLFRSPETNDSISTMSARSVSQKSSSNKNSSSLESSSGVNNMFRALLNLGNAWSKNPQALECIWSLYCIDLDRTARKDGIFAIAARINSVGLRLIMEQIPTSLTLDVMLRSLLGWDGLPCHKMFPKCESEESSSFLEIHKPTISTSYPTTRKFI